MKRLVLASLATCAAISAQAAVLLEIDISNPAAVRFTATGNLAAADSVYPASINGGITIENFFTSSVTINQDSPVGGTLTPFLNGNALYDLFGSYEYAENVEFGTGNDLSVYSSESSESQIFSTESIAFAGEAVFDFSAFIELLPAIGTTGNIFPGYTFDAEPAVGQWTVVGAAIPEPSTYAMGAGLLALGAVALRRRKA
ncbi:MAG: PEP-CTERM sorting domain-containing protein [Verrucomicrobiota bacterium JB022]|nr:PEP-CTERM sorting domain-containing protein [Verrucomicrobiota bacterium JB022]